MWCETYQPTIHVPQLFVLSISQQKITYLNTQITINYNHVIC